MIDLLGGYMERLEKKVIKGNTYYYYSKWERVNGKCRRVWQKYLGKLEDIASAVDENGPTPQFAEVFQFGLPSTLWNECNLQLQEVKNKTVDSQ